MVRMERRFLILSLVEVLLFGGRGFFGLIESLVSFFGFLSLGGLFGLDLFFGLFFHDFLFFGVTVSISVHLGLLVNDFLIGLLSIDLRCGSLVGSGGNVHGAFGLVNTHLEKL